MAIKVTLRKRVLASGKVSLYLDYWPAVRNPRTQQYSRREYLGIYLVKNPKTGFDKNANAEKLRQAEAIRAQRELALINEEFGFIDKARQKMDFLKYFRSKLATHDQKWTRVYNHFERYSKGRCVFNDITVEFCNGFKEYLLSADKLNAAKLKNKEKSGTKLSQNSAAGYWSTFRALLAIAYRERYLNENVNDFLDPIDTIETRRQFLTQDELNTLAATPCEIPVLKAASLFSCLTGLRISDILALEWENITKHTDGGWCIRLQTEKTDNEATLPISDQAYELCGTAGKGKIFKGLNRGMTRQPLQNWLKDAGITDKHITFHCLRHTYATLQIAQGTGIYTVSKMITHKNVSTTQIYADLVDSKKREAAEAIKINPK